MPFPLSVTDESEPSVVVIETVPPLDVRAAPALFFSVIVIVEVVAPPELSA